MPSAPGSGGRLRVGAGPRTPLREAVSAPGSGGRFRVAAGAAIEMPWPHFRQFTTAPAVSSGHSFWAWQFGQKRFTMGAGRWGTDVGGLEIITEFCASSYQLRFTIVA